MGWQQPPRSQEAIRRAYEQSAERSLERRREFADRQARRLLPRDPRVLLLAFGISLGLAAVALMTLAIFGAVLLPR